MRIKGWIWAKALYAGRPSVHQLKLMAMIRDNVAYSLPSVSTDGVRKADCYRLWPKSNSLYA
jgi:hypothetical protein